MRRAVVWGLLPIVATAAILAVLPSVWFGDSPYTTSLAVQALVFASYGVGFNLIFGSTNQLFLCMGALAGIGGYGAVIFADEFDLPLAAGVAAGTASAAIVGGLLSWIAVRRSLGVIFTGVVTLVFSLAFTNLLFGQRDLTGAETGLVVTGTPADLGDDRVGGYYLFAATVGSAMIGLAGALYAYSAGFISPATYAFERVDVRLLVLVAFGGLGTLLGPVIGAGVFAVLDERLSASLQLREVLYGVFVIAIFLGFRRGVTHTVVALFNRLFARRRAKPTHQLAFERAPDHPHPDDLER